MAQTVAMEVVEARFGGRPVREIIVDSYRRLRSIERVAQELGVARGTLWVWRQRLGIGDAELRLAAIEADQLQPGSMGEVGSPASQD